MVDDVAVGVRHAPQLEIGRVGAVEDGAANDQRLAGFLARRHPVDVVTVADADGRLAGNRDAGRVGLPRLSRRPRAALARRTHG